MSFINKTVKEEDKKTYKGRSRIDSQERMHGSERARKGNLEVIRKGFTCPYCNHKKALLTMYGLKKCAKCKKVVR